MLFKQFLLEGRPFYDYKGNKYVASRNDHYSKNDEEISKEEYERARDDYLFMNKDKKEELNKDLDSDKPITFDRNMEGEEYIKKLMPNILLDFSSKYKDKDIIKDIAESIEQTTQKFPRIVEFLQNGFIGDIKAINKYRDKIIQKQLEEYNYDNLNIDNKKIIDHFIDKTLKEVFDKSKVLGTDKDITIEYILNNTSMLFDDEKSKLNFIKKDTGMFSSLFSIFKSKNSEIDDIIQKNNLDKDMTLKEIANNKEVFDKIKNIILSKFLVHFINKALPEKLSLLTFAAYFPGMTPSSRGIVLNTFSIRSRSEASKRNKENEDYFNFKVGTSQPTTKSMICHEFGHLLDDMFDLSHNTDIISKYYSFTHTIFGKKGMIEDVSEYASKSIKEFIAECFAEYMLSQNPRETPKEIGKIIEKIYNRNNHKIRK